MKNWLFGCLFLLCSGVVFGQAGLNVDQNCAAWGAAGTTCSASNPAASGAQVFLPDIRGTITNQFEVLVVGTAPSSLTVTVVGCMRGGTCSGTLASSSGTASQIVTPSTTNLNIYDKYGVTVSWTGGDATTRFVVNRTGTTARLPSSNSGSGTVSANNGTVGAFSNYAAAGGSTTVGPDANLSDSGTAITSLEQLILPVGTLTTPTLRATGSASNTGIEMLAASTVFDYAGSAFESAASSGFIVGNAEYYAFSSTAASSGAVDTTTCRQSAGVMEVGSGTSCASTGGLKAASYVSAGTQFTQDTGCGTIASSSGGATAGQFTTVGSTSCTTVVTFGNTATAPHGWACYAHDLTTAADYANPRVSSTTTTATIVTGTIVAGDVIEFGCVGY